ncbi:MAG: BapA prefix-like domain-containing protein [Acinetobacter sp.]|nr:BapA prefix-like domain-containing protein [Acinetobacter sp.]
MTRVIVSSKTSLNILQDEQIKDVILSQPSIIQLGIDQESIKSIIKQGDDLVITLKNGEKIIIRDFYNEMNASEHTLALSNDDGSYSIAEFDDSGKFVRYTSSSQAVPQVSTELPTQVSSVSEPADDLGITKSQLIKGGLIALAAEGLYLLAVNDDDDNNNDKNDSTDMIAPITPTAVLISDTQTITGKTEAKAKIEIKDSTGKVIATGQADQDGNYTVKLNEPLVNGSKVAVSAIDSAGNVSKSTVVTGTKDTIAPDSPLAQLNQDGTIVTGKAEANAKISVFDADGKLLGSVTANKEGLYSIKLSSALISDKGGTVVAEDAAGNKSAPSKVIAGKDTLAPDQPLIEVNAEGTRIEGRAEVNTKVQVKDSDGKIIGIGTTDAQGKFVVQISPALTTGKKGTIVLEDSAGNTSKPLEIIAGKDTIAPSKATAELNPEGTLLTGTAEANAKMEVKSADGQTTLGSGTVGADGKFSLSLSPALTDKNIAKIYIIDSSGNRSEPTDVFGAKDTIAPTKPLLQTVMDDIGAVKGTVSSGGSTDDTKPTLSGIGEAKAVLTIFDNGYPIGTVTVGDNGKWSYTVTNDLILGSHKITLTQTDVAGNTSELSDAFNFTIVAPAQSSALMLSDSLIIEEVQTSLVDSVNLDRLLTVPNMSDSFVDEEQLSIPLEHLLIAEELETDVIDQLLNEFDQNLVSQNSLVGTVETISVQTDLAETSFKELFNDLDVSSNWMF